MIPLTQGQSALVDDEDFEWLSKYKWSFYGPKNYAQNGARERKPRTIFMHRLILDAPKGLVVDHIDGNGLNNRRSNLRLASRQQNARNRPKQRNNQSGFKGVCQYRRRWKAAIRANGKHIYLGLFQTAELAAAAYNEAAEKFHGQFAFGHETDDEISLILLAIKYCDSVLN